MLIFKGYDDPTGNKSSPVVHPFVEAIAKGSNLYQIQINATNFDGEIDLNGTQMTLTGPGQYTAEYECNMRIRHLRSTTAASPSLFRIEVMDNQRHVSISFTDQHGRRTSLNRPIITCNCIEGQGSCVFPRWPDDDDSSRMLVVAEAGCLCEKGFVGTTCAEVENPCA